MSKPYSLSNTSNSRYYFWLFILIHTIIWTAGPALLRSSVPHDTLEGITWGLQWQFGYSKHPFLTAWLCAAFTQFFGVVGWPVYLMAQLAVLTTFWATWKLAQLILPPIHALISTLILEGIFFYNINSFNFTPDTLQSPLWALLIWFFYLALTTQTLWSWLGVGVIAALCVCTKYQIALLFLPMLLLCCFNPLARKSFKRTEFYCALGLFFLLITPHLIWLYQHDFITLIYALKTPSDYTQNESFLNHLTYPLRFLVNNCLNVMGLFLLLWPFYNKQKMPLKRYGMDPLKWQILIFCGLGPLILSVLLCIITGDYFAARWSTPYYSTLGILVLAYLRPSLTPKNLKQFAITLILLSLLLFTGRMSSLFFYSRPESDAFLPNQKIAVTLSKLWHAQYATPLPFLAGSNYLVATVTPYLSDRPKPWLSWKHTANSWINEQEVHKKGGIFIWDEGNNYRWDKDSMTHTQMSQSVLRRFPKLQFLPKLVFYRTSNHQPVVIGVAILPPD